MEKEEGRVFLKVCDVISRQSKTETDILLEKVRGLHCSIRQPGEYDADDVLEETMKLVNYKHPCSMAEELFDLYRNAETMMEKEMFEKMFACFTDMDFKAFLEKCERKINSKIDVNYAEAV